MSDVRAPGVHWPPREGVLATLSLHARAEPGRELAALQCALVALLALSGFALLFLLRAWDDNRLVSWRWVFASSDLLLLLILLALGLLLAYSLSRAPWSARHAAPALGVCAFLASVPFWSEPEVMLDAARYFVQAKHLALYGAGHFVNEWGRQIPAWTDLPLVPFLHGILFSLAGETRLAIQLFHSLLFAGAVFLTYLIGKSLWDRPTGICGAALLLGMPYLLTQVPLMLADVPAMFFFTLAAYATITALERGGALRLCAAAVALALALLTKYSAWIALAIPALLVVFRPADGRRQAAARASALVLGTALAAGAFLLGKAEVVAGQLALLWSYQLPGLERWQEGVISTFLFQIHPFVTLAALGSLAVAIHQKDSRYAWIGAIVLLALLLGSRRSRYFIIAMPMLALAAAYGLRAIREIPTRQFVASCAAVSALVVAFAGYLPFLRETSAVNLKRAGELLDAMSGDAVEVIVLPPTRSGVNPAVAVPLLDLFTHKRVIYRRDLSPVSSPQRSAQAISPVRFTWEYPDAPFHLAPPGHRVPVVLVMSALDQPVPQAVASRLAGYRVARELAVSERLFRHQTLVRIYRPTEGIRRE